MSDWEDYARRQPINAETYASEPTQAARVARILDRCVGSVLDVGGGDGWIARQLMDRGHEVRMIEASPTRVRRAWELKVPAVTLDDLSGEADQSWDTVLLGEVLEHCPDPGILLRDAFRIARERVIITVPLLGWPDPTHQWRISLDHLVSAEADNPDRAPSERGLRPESSEQIIVTWQKGLAWPLTYWQTDPKWKAQFEDGH